MKNKFPTLNKKLGVKIKEYREKNGYSQESFALKVGVHRTYIGCIERGEKNITIVIAKLIANALNVSLSELFKDI